IMKNPKSFLIGLSKYAIGFGLLGYMVYANWSGKGDQPGLKDLVQQTPNFAAFGLVAVLWIVVSSLQFYRWYILVRAVNLPFTVLNAFRLGFVGAFYNAFLPGSIGGDVVKAFVIAREQPDRKSAAVATVIIDRLFGLFGLMWYSALIGGICWYQGDERIANSNYLKFVIRTLGIGSAVMVGGFLLAMLLPTTRGEAIEARLRRVPKLGKTLGDIWGAVFLYSRRPLAVLAAVGLSAVAHTLIVLVLHYAVRVYQYGEPATLSEHFIVGPIGFIAQAFFPAPGGAGGGEYIFGYLYTLLDRFDGTARVGRMVIRIVEWVFGFVGYMVYLSMKNEIPAVEDPAEPNSATATEITPPK
ncbi:MAG: lysylphosphatidylglycerol synthase transmembrane domain-containing protein, partial [Gemmataceae bacterium]